MTLPKTHVPAVLVTLTLLLMAVAPAAALTSENPDPPTNLQAEYDGATETLTLTWDAPDASHAYTYNVYRDGVLVNSTGDTTHTEDLPVDADLADMISVFYVTTLIDGTSQESNPGGSLAIIDGPLCGIIIVTISPTVFPFVFAGVDHACVEGWQRTIDRLIGGLLETPLLGSTATIPGELGNHDGLLNPVL